MELVSIIMPAYNCGQFIKESIDSVESQTYTNWELLIVDDCSTDNTADIVDLYKDKRIHCIRNSQNLGAASSREKAIKMSQGRYIAFLDADDKWLPNKLEKQIMFMMQNNIALSYTPYYVLHPTKGTIIHTCPKTLTYYQLTKWNRIGCLTVIYDRILVGEVVIPKIQKRNDYALWLTILRKGIIAYCYSEPLAYYRSHNGLTKGNKFSFIKYHYILFNEVLGYSKFLALIMTIRNIFFYFIFYVIDTKNDTIK